MRENKILVLCDFDGTVSVKDVGFHLLTHFSGGRWEELDRDFVTGKIGSREAYRRMVRDLKGGREDYRAVALGLGEIDPDFPALVRFCRDAGWTVKIISDGFGLYIQAFLEQLGVGEVEYFANELRFLPGGEIRAEFPHASESCGDCGCCKLSILTRHREEYDAILYIGDGISDRCAAPEADFVFAKRSLYRHCVEKGFPVFSFRNFSDVLRLLHFRLQGIVFDLDGTLIDSFTPIYESFRHTLVVLGYDPKEVEQKRSVVGATLEESLREFIAPEEVSRAVKIFRDYYAAHLRNGTTLLPGVKETLAGMREIGIPLAVATNKFGPFAREIIGFLGIKDHFQRVLGAGDGFPPKPSPEILLALAAELGVRPGEMAYLGDSPLDIELGNAAGNETIAIASGYYSREDLGKEKPSLMLGRLPDLIPFARFLSDGTGR